MYKHKIEPKQKILFYLESPSLVKRAKRAFGPERRPIKGKQYTVIHYFMFCTKMEEYQEPGAQKYWALPGIWCFKDYTIGNTMLY